MKCSMMVAELSKLAGLSLRLTRSKRSTLEGRAGARAEAGGG